MLLVLTTGVLASTREHHGLPTVLLIYTLIVVIVAVIGGIYPALATAVVAFLLADWYFTRPIHTWTIDEGEHFIGLRRVRGGRRRS